MLNKLKNLIKIGMKSETVSEKNIKVDLIGGVIKEALKIIPYGLMYKLPDNDIMTVLLQPEANEESLVAFCTDIKNRDDDLNELEVKIGIPTLKSRIKFTDDDKIELFAPEKIDININDNLSLSLTENETIFEDINGNKITIDSSGISIDDINGNNIVMGAGSIKINGNLEVST